MSPLILTCVLALGPEPEAALSWLAVGEECPSAAAVSGQLPKMEQGVRYDRYVAKATRTESGWVAQVDGPESRELRADSCQELADAVVLLVELSMRRAEAAAVARRVEVTQERYGSEAAGEDDESAERAAIAEPAPVATSVTADAGAGRRESGLGWSVAAAGGAAFLVVPTVAGGFEVTTGPRGRHWAVDLGMLGRPRFSGSDPGREDYGSVFAIWSGIVRGCGVPGRGRVEFPLCGGVELGAVIGQGTGDLAPARRAAAPWFAGRISVGIRVEAHPVVRPFLAVSALALPARPSFVIDGAGSVWDGARFGSAVSMGIELRIPAKTPGSGH